MSSRNSKTNQAHLTFPDYMVKFNRGVSSPWGYFAIIIMICALLVSGCTNVEKVGSQSSLSGLVILVDDPQKIDSVQEIAQKYHLATGIDVIVKDISTDFPEVSSSVISPGDLVVVNISRMIDYADKGHLVSLNSILNNGSSVNWTFFERPPLVLVGEYPDRSGEIFALPYSQDALGIVYRADIFQDPANADAFCLTYGYPLGAVGSYTELSDIVRFFSRNESVSSGIGFSGLKGIDPGSSPWYSIVASYGSGIYDRSGQVSGIWNSTATVSALEMFRNLSAETPDGAGLWGDEDVANAFISGKTAIAITWFSRFSEIQAAAQRQNMTIGFLPLPGQLSDHGSFRGVLVRMDGLALLKGGDVKKAEQFFSWFYSPHIQLELAEKDMQPSVIPVLDSFSYLSLNGYNYAFPESMRVGVSMDKGESASIIRVICEDLVREILLSPEFSFEKVQESLDRSVVKIDGVTSMGQEQKD